MEDSSRAEAALNVVILALRDGGGVARMRTASKAYRDDERLIRMQAIEMLYQGHQGFGFEFLFLIDEITWMLRNLPFDLLQGSATTRKRTHDGLVRCSSSLRNYDDGVKAFTALCILIERFGCEHMDKAVAASLALTSVPLLDKVGLLELMSRRGARGVSLQQYAKLEGFFARDTPLEVFERLYPLLEAQGGQDLSVNLLVTSIRHRHEVGVACLLRLGAGPSPDQFLADAPLKEAVVTNNHEILRLLVDCPRFRGSGDVLITFIQFSRGDAATGALIMRLKDEGRLPLSEYEYWRALQTLELWPNDVVLTNLLQDARMDMDRLRRHLTSASTKHIFRVTTKVPDILDSCSDFLYDILFNAVHDNDMKVLRYLLSRRTVNNPFIRNCRLLQAANHAALRFLVRLASAAVAPEAAPEHQTAAEAAPEHAADEQVDEQGDDLEMDAVLQEEKQQEAIIFARARLFAPSLSGKLPNILIGYMKSNRLMTSITPLLELQPTHPLCTLEHRYETLATDFIAVDLSITQILDSVPVWPPHVLVDALVARAASRDSTTVAAMREILLRFPKAPSDSQLQQVLMAAVEEDNDVVIDIILRHSDQVCPGAAIAGMHDQAALRRAVALGAGRAVRALLANGGAAGARVLPDMVEQARVMCVPSVYQDVCNAVTDYS